MSKITSSEATAVLIVLALGIMAYAAAFIPEFNQLTCASDETDCVSKVPSLLERVVPLYWILFLFPVFACTLRRAGQLAAGPVMMVVIVLLAIFTATVPGDIAILIVTALILAVTVDRTIHGLVAGSSSLVAIMLWPQLAEMTHGMGSTTVTTMIIEYGVWLAVPLVLCVYAPFADKMPWRFRNV